MREECGPSSSERPLLDSILLYETWESHEDVLQVQLERPYRRAWHEALPSLLVEPREISVWEPLRSDRRATS